MKRVIACMLTILMLIQPVSVLAASVDVEDSVTEQVFLTEENDGEDTQSGEGEGNDAQQPGEGEGEGDDAQQPGEGEGEGDDTQQPSEGEGEGDDTQQPGEGEDEEDKEVDNTPFACHVLNADGTKLNPYWSEDFRAWYVFVPSTVDMEQMNLHYTGTIAEVSAGTVDEEAKVVEAAFEATGSELVVTMENGESHKVIAMQSKLPSVHITLNDTTLAQVHKDKNVKYKENTVSIMDPSGRYDLLAENSVEFKGRGNSTWAYFEKKAYQIKFDSKISVLGMGKAKTWVLLANAADETLMRNMLTLNLADQIGMDYTSRFRYVDLWVDGEYLGNYMIGEKVEMGDNRVELDAPYATLFEQDTSFYYEEDYWFHNDLMGKYFTVKDTNADDSDPAEVQIAIDAFQETLDELMTYLYTTPSEDVTLDELQKMIDVDSFAKYYLVNEYCGNAESVASSFYAHMNGVDDVIHLGPVWDFDCSMGNYKDESDYYLSAHVLFNCLLASPAFYNRTVEIFNQNRASFAKLSADAAAIKEEIAESVTMNFIRWNIWGEPNPKDSLKDYAASYEEGYSRLESWLYKHAAAFEVQHTKIPYANVADDCSTMNIVFDNGDDDTTIVFAIWSDKSGQDDLKWYYPEKNADGLWEAEVDLSGHNTLGKYTIHASTVKNGVRSRVAIGYAYIEKLTSTEVSAKLSEDLISIEATLSGVGMYKELSVYVWCKTDGDSDLKKYAVSDMENYTKTCVIGLNEHDEVGEYCVQFYGKTGDEWTLIGETTVDVPEKTWPDMDVKVAAAQKELTVTITDAKQFESLDVVVWGEANGEDDKVTYPASKNDDETWSVLVDLDDHGENGTYQIELWGSVSADQKKILVAQAQVENIVFSHECSWVYRLYNANTQEHLLTANEEEMNFLLENGWTLDGAAWKAAKTGLPVYRLYNPYDDWHTYSTSEEEMQTLTELGWTVDGIVFTSAEAANVCPVYRLFNPYEQMNYHLLTASVDERDFLLGLGWLLDGIALNAVQE